MYFNSLSESNTQYICTKHIKNFASEMISVRNRNIIIIFKYTHMYNFLINYDRFICILRDDGGGSCVLLNILL